MARKYQYISDRYAWNLEQCEEEIFIAAWVESSNSISPDWRWARNVEHFFFELGKGLSFEALDEFNALRKSQGIEPVTFRETEIGDYARSRDEQAKSQRRKQMREEFTALNSEALDEHQARARAKEQGLAPAHYTFEEIQSRKLQQHPFPPVIPIRIPMRPRSERHANFQRLLPKRTDKVLVAIQSLTNLSSPNYEFEELEVEKAFYTLRERVEESHARFRRRLTK
jgi:hypothetical protein